MRKFIIKDVVFEVVEVANKMIWLTYSKYSYYIQANNLIQLVKEVPSTYGRLIESYPILIMTLLKRMHGY